MERLKSLSSLDGRYNYATQELRDIFSEYGLMKSRTFVEIQWIKFLARELNLFSLEDNQLSEIDLLYSNFDIQDAAAVKEIEQTTNHDVKAVEYFLKKKFQNIGLSHLQEWIHFSCTSADINNTSYALMLKEGRECLIERFKELLMMLEDLAKKYKSVPMMARTHGQPATPTTVGKEFINFASRIKGELNELSKGKIEAKFNGATGNFNAHVAAYPDIDWIEASQKFLNEYLGVSPLIFSTQINTNSYISRMMHSLVRLSSIIIDLDRDMWGYISFGYFKQKLKKGEIGSSTMPHKVNPIDFENSEGNFGLAIPMMEHMATKLLNSRFQRDLTDSTVMRSLGAVFGYLLLGIKSTLKGLNKLEISEVQMENDLNNNWELLAEPIQTVMRVYGEENPYEKLKELTRGQKISKVEIEVFIDKLEKTPDIVKQRLKKLSPNTYIGLAEQLVEQYFKKS